MFGGNCFPRRGPCRRQTCRLCSCDFIVFVFWPIRILINLMLRVWLPSTMFNKIRTQEESVIFMTIWSLINQCAKMLLWKKCKGSPNCTWGNNVQWSILRGLVRCVLIGFKDKKKAFVRILTHKNSSVPWLFTLSPYLCKRRCLEEIVSLEGGLVVDKRVSWSNFTVWSLIDECARMLSSEKKC